jgi:hypothetical protein
MQVMQKKKGLDIIDKILETCYHANPDALFIMSLMHQYEERGSLSKKQLQGLLLKAKKVQDMPENWLATLEATILKMPNRFKSTIEEIKPVEAKKDEKHIELMQAILAKYPQHKRVLFLQSKYNNKEPLHATEIAEIEKFGKLLLK